MTSKQVMLSVTVLALIACSWLACGCTLSRTQQAKPVLQSPYPDRQVWAVVPLRNESGSMQANGTFMADHLARQLEVTHGLNVLPVNRVLNAMEALELPRITNAHQAMQLQQMLGADGLIVGTITAYDPYDPPKLGIAVELYVDPGTQPGGELIDVRRLSRASTDELSLPRHDASRGQPVNVVSNFFDAADPRVREAMQRYAAKRGGVDKDLVGWRLYRISMDLYMEFVAHAVSEQLLEAERQRITPPPTATTSAS